MAPSYGSSSPPGRHKPKYRLIRRDLYEKRYPGRIARKGIACMKTMIDDKRIEVVMLVKWDMDQEDIQGVKEDEVIDDGEFEPELEKESKEDELVAPLPVEEEAPAEKESKEDEMLRGRQPGSNIWNPKTQWVNRWEASVDRTPTLSDFIHYDFMVQSRMAAQGTIHRLPF